ncbi:32801_t:CDS:1, partial [Gigaspora margarita]
MQYVKELYAKKHNLPMRDVSSTIANSWREEPNHVVNLYEEIARQAKEQFDQKFLKLPTPQKVPVSLHSQQRTINKHTIPLITQSYYNFYSNDAFLPPPNYQMHSYDLNQKYFR